MKPLKEIWRVTQPHSCKKGCSFNPTSMSDYCDEHRPREKNEMRVGDWVSYGEGHLLEVVEVMDDGRVLWCSDSLSEVSLKLVKEIRTPDGRIFRR